MQCVKSRAHHRPLGEHEIRDLRRAVRKIPANLRVTSIEVNGQSYWVKRQKKLSLRWRLQKGNPARAFEREREGLHLMHTAGMLVPRIVDEGPDYFVTPDAGISLAALCKSPAFEEAERQAALAEAARTLHELHDAGMAHGRPNLKDFLWDGQRITLIDLERFGKVRKLHSAQVIDFIIFALSCFAVANRSLPQIDQALYLYRMLDMRGVYIAANRWLHWLRWLDPVARWLQRFRSSRDIAAIPRLFKWLRERS